MSWHHALHRALDEPFHQPVGWRRRAVATSAPGYLAGAAIAPAGAWGAQRLIESYTGPLFRLTRASDSATMDAEQVGDYPDYAALTAFIGASTATVTTWYDQTGNGAHKQAGSTGATTPNAPPQFSPGVRHAGAAPILFAGIPSSTNVAGETNSLRRTLAADISLNSQAMTYFACVQPISSHRGFGIATFSLADFGTKKLDMQHGGRFTFAIVGGTNSAAGAIPMHPDIYGVRTSPTQVTVFNRGVGTNTARTLSSDPIEEMTTGFYATVSFMARSKFFSEVCYNGTLTTEDTDAVIASLRLAHTVPTTFDYRWVLSGDSNEEGTGCEFLQNSLAKVQFTQQPELFNTSIHGQTLAARYAARTTYWSPYYTSDYGVGRCIATIEEGTNDLNAGTTAVDLYAILSDSVSYLQGLGYKVGVMTIIKNGQHTAAENTQREEYNALILANSAGADAVSDPASAPEFADTLDATYFHPDQVHFKDAGHAVRATFLQGLASALLSEPA